MASLKVSQIRGWAKKEKKKSFMQGGVGKILQKYLI
jgi:hypothetical protein